VHVVFTKATTFANLFSLENHWEKKTFQDVIQLGDNIKIIHFNP